MKFHSTRNIALLGASIAALTTTAFAQATGQPNGVETVTVTGSLVISNVANSPTPLTAVSTEQLLSTTPTIISDALNKLPVFYGSRSPQNTNSSANNAVGNVLSLRNFGANRTLVLMDGQRVAPSNFDGTVDTDVLPELLVQRVDVVTGGASAVYGSDAVTGVVNYILDKNFDGFKYNLNSGVSKYQDAFSYQGGAAAGMDILEGRGHIEGSLHFYHQDAVPITNRPYEQGNRAWGVVGSGTAASPYVTVGNITKPTQANQGGIVNCTCSANNTTFLDNGVLAPFDLGTLTKTPNLNIGGDGGVNDPASSFQNSLVTLKSFGRFSYDFDDSTTAFVEFTASEAINHGNHAPATLNPGPGRGNQFYANNAYLPPATQAQLEAGNKTGTFTLAEYLNGEIGGEPVYENGDTFSDQSVDRYLSATAGITGSIFGKYRWKLFYTHGTNRQEEVIPHNTNIQKLIASEDAVLGPSGQVVCNVSLTTYASLYPNCVPINPFGPSAMTQSQFDYFTDRTYYVATNTLDDIGANIGGDLPGLPAGAITAAFSAEVRRQSMDVESPFDPGNLVDCTGLRLCTPPYASLYDQTVVAPENVSYNVYEFSGEVNVPLLRDLPLIQQFNVDLAGRYTNYSTSGGVETWKIGLDYHVNDSIRFRGTASVDIRAPNLFDLYQPLTINTGGFNDELTKVNLSIVHKTQGNPNLKPEVAHTYTAGVVLTPDLLPGFTMSLDYYRISLSGALTNLTGSSEDLQSICIKSGGSSPYCALTFRSFPYTNTTPANFPLYYLTEEVNSAEQRTEGEDIELDYTFAMSALISDLPGSVAIRNLTSHQPYITTVNYPGAPESLTPMPRMRNTTFVTYNFGSWGINLQDTWDGGFSPKTLATNVYVKPHIRSFNTLDVTVDKQLSTDSNDLDLYFSVQNLINAQPDIDAPINPGPPGETYPVPPSENAMGRYFIVGIRGAL